MSDAKNTNDKKDWIVTENGQRSGGAMTNAEAIAEADRRRKLLESGGSKKPSTVEVKRNIMG